MKHVLVYNFSGDVDDILHLYPLERLARIAAVIRAQGVDATILDRANFDDIDAFGPEFLDHLASLSFEDSSLPYEATLDREAEHVLARPADAVFVNLWHGTGFKFSLDLVARLKRARPDLPIYAIGQKVDEFKQSVLQFAKGNFDALIVGLGYDAVEQLVAGRRRTDIPNLIFEVDGEPLVTPRRPLTVDRYPDPDYSEATYEKIDRKIPIRLITLSNQACPNQCVFCVRPAVYGRELKKRSIPRIMREITGLHQSQGITHFHVEDSTPPRKSLTELADAIVHSNLKGRIRLSGVSRVDSNSMEDFGLLRKAGFVSLFFGIESLDETVLRNLRKGTDVETISRTLKKAHDSGIRTVGSFIFPTPGITRDAMRTTLSRLAELKPWLDALVVLPAGIQPDTEWYRKPEEHGIRLAENYVKEAVIYPLKYMVPLWLWKPFPFTYEMMGKTAEEVSFQNIVGAYREFLEHVRNNLQIPGIPDSYFLLADLVNRPPAEVAKEVIGCLMQRDYQGMRDLFAAPQSVPNA